MQRGGDFMEMKDEKGHYPFDHIRHPYITIPHFSVLLHTQHLTITLKEGVRYKLESYEFLSKHDNSAFERDRMKDARFPRPFKINLYSYIIAKNHEGGVS